MSAFTSHNLWGFSMELLLHREDAVDLLNFSFFGEAWFDELLLSLRPGELLKLKADIRGLVVALLNYKES